MVAREVAKSDEVKQEINSLKQENKKLKLSIERLKTLDIEMEERHRP